MGTDKEEGNKTKTKDCKVCADHMGSVLGSAKARFDEGETCLHKDHHGGADDHPHKAGLLSENGDRLGFLSGSDGWDKCQYGAQSANGGDRSTLRRFHDRSFQRVWQGSRRQRRVDGRRVSRDQTSRYGRTVSPISRKCFESMNGAVLPPRIGRTASRQIDR